MTKNETKAMLRDPKSWKTTGRIGNTYRVICMEAYGLVVERLQAMIKFQDWAETYKQGCPVYREEWVTHGQFIISGGFRERISDTDLLRQVWEASRG